VRASPRRVRRVMREHELLAPRRAVAASAKTHDGTIVTERVNCQPLDSRSSLRKLVSACFSRPGKKLSA
jgi:hypothetical protein